jgi:hypothetical protein
MEVKVTKYELYPQVNPSSLAVGFSISLENNKSFYIDTIVPMGLNEEQAISEAWKQLENSINARVEELTATVVEAPVLESSAVGKLFIPPVSEGKAGELLTPEVIELLEEKDLNS